MEDDEAERAASGRSSAAASLPSRLHKSVPCSVTAAKRAHLERLPKEAKAEVPLYMGELYPDGQQE